MATLFVLMALPSPATASSSGGGWTIVCKYARSLPDDPIVYPGQPGASHLHDFFGSYETDADSTPESLLASWGTSCKPTVDKSGYWFPSLLVDGVPVPPTKAAFYYRGPNKLYDASLVRPIPPGLVMIAGESRADLPQPMEVTYWQCGTHVGSPKNPEPYDCSPWPGTWLTASLTFPSCWNGRDLDSPDHKSHLAYPTKYGSNLCPLTHPVQIVRVRAEVNYSTVTNGAGATLSSGSPYSYHGDFMNGWDQESMVYLTNNCVKVGKLCRFGYPIPTSASTERTSTNASATAPEKVEDQVTVKRRMTHTGLLCGRAMVGAPTLA
jgi:hypothetical protein